VFEGASVQGDFTVSWAALGTLGREAEGGRARRVPQFPHVHSAEQSANRPGSQTMPECHFNQYNATSTKICLIAHRSSQRLFSSLVIVRGASWPLVMHLPLPFATQKAV